MVSNTSPAPCLGLPGFVQRRNIRNWHIHPETLAAQAVCRNLCPTDRFRACAREALRAGQIFDEPDRPRVADGVVMAGVVCRGDAATARTLHNLLATDVNANGDAGRHCLDCRRPMYTRRHRKPGHVRHEAGGRCAGCCRAAGRAA